jgi:hypothetical protein
MHAGMLLFSFEKKEVVMIEIVSKKTRMRRFIGLFFLELGCVGFEKINRIYTSTRLNRSNFGSFLEKIVENGFYTEGSSFCFLELGRKDFKG